MKQLLFQQKFSLHRTSHQSHLIYRVYVPVGTEKIEIHFNYHPITEESRADIEQSLIREGLPISLIEDDTTIRNLLTLTVIDPDTYRGSRHCFAEEQVIEISSKNATEGFSKKDMVEGYWEFIINCHGVFSEKVDGKIKIIGVSGQDYKISPSQPFEQIDQSRRKKRTKMPDEYVIKRAELHAHTNHSDGQHLTEELIHQAEVEEIDWLAITDHNTYTALLEVKENHLHENINLLNGIEYTTYFGHFLVHGSLNQIVKDWTKISRDNMSNFLNELKENDVYITIAHPFDNGNPFCTGCRWEYALKHLNDVDAIEVWNGTNPHQSLSNEDAFAKWVQLLSRGHEIAAATGRDWHHSQSEEHVAYTYLLLPQGAMESDVLESLRLGRTYCSIRPDIDVQVNRSYTIGDRIEENPHEFIVSLKLSNVQQGDEVYIYSERDIVFHGRMGGEGEWKKKVRFLNKGYALLRIEIRNDKKEMIAFTNPIYIHS